MHGNKPQWDLNQISYFFIHENAFENVEKISAILSQLQCVQYNTIANHNTSLSTVRNVNTELFWNETKYTHKQNKANFFPKNCKRTKFQMKFVQLKRNSKINKTKQKLPVFTAWWDDSEGFLEISIALLLEPSTTPHILTIPPSGQHTQLSLPNSNFLNTEAAVKIMESMIPATVKVPPMMAHTWKWMAAYQTLTTILLLGLDLECHFFCLNWYETAPFKSYQKL